MTTTTRRTATSSTSTSLHQKKDWTTSLFPVVPKRRSTNGSSSSPDSSSNTAVATNGTRQTQRSKSTTIILEPLSPPPDKGFLSQAVCQFYAGSIGALTGFGIAGFKLSIESIREYSYGDLLGSMDSSSVLKSFESELGILIPLFGGVMVGVLALLGRLKDKISSPFPPGVGGIVDQIDKDCLYNRDSSSKFQELADSFRKASAAIFTLGTGCSLGPEGPGVEIGIAASRIWAMLWPQGLDDMSKRSQSSPSMAVPDTFDTNQYDEVVQKAIQIQRNRLFLACGAAAGVSSGFNAPLAGVFFAIEVIQRNLPVFDFTGPNGAMSLEDDDDSTTMAIMSSSQANGIITSSTTSTPSSTVVYEFQQESLSTDAGTITPILTSSVVSALVTRILLGNELALRLLEYEIPTPLRELPVYLMLGATSGLCAVLFSQTTKIFKSVFDGEVGPESVRETIESIPDYVKPAIGGLTCGIIGYFFPPILFFGYETLNGLLMNNRLETTVAVSLLLAKIGATAISAASGLVGGTLAPTLFMGGMVGLTFHNILVGSLDTSMLPDALSTMDTAFGTPFQIADLPAYTMVGAASFLAAVFRAPLTASLLAFELTKNYDVLVPLLASAGVGTLFCDLLETRLEEKTDE